MKEFKDKIAVITGGASGIGRSIAERCCQEGMKVVLADVEAKMLSHTEKELKSTGATVISVLTDVSKVDDIKALAQKTLDTFGAVHLLFNNAGVAVGTYLWEYTFADLEWVVGVNLWGVIYGVRIFVPIMLKQDTKCHIINTSSLAGLIPGNGIYGITKHNLVALSESLAAELSYIKSKIKVSVLCPGFVKTRILECERNHPSEIISHPEFESSQKLFKQMVNSGLSPNKVAEIVFQAIRDNKFYILTDKHFMYKKIVKRRLNTILKAFEEDLTI